MISGWAMPYPALMSGGVRAERFGSPSLVEFDLHPEIKVKGSSVYS